MRGRISERNLFPSFNIKKEYCKIHELFSNAVAFRMADDYGSMMDEFTFSYEDYLKSLFLQWPLRGSFTSLEEMLEELDISPQSFSQSCTEDKLLDYIQFIFNAIQFIDSMDSKIPSIALDKPIRGAILENAWNVCGRLNSKIEVDDDSGEMFITYKNDVATAIGIQHSDIEPTIVEYLKIDNRSDIRKKDELLCSFAKKLEPYENKFKGTNFSKLCSDTTFLLNRTGARHSLNDSMTEQQFKEMSENELLEWRDYAFQSFLACMAVLPYLDFYQKINDVKQRT